MISKIRTRIKSFDLYNPAKIAIFYLAVLGFQFLFLYPLHNSMDLPLCDESNYMGWGRNFALGMDTVVYLAWSPAYVLLYAVISRFLSPEMSFFFMKYFLTLSVSVLLFTLLLRNLRSIHIAALLSFIWAASCYNVYADNLVYLFAVLIFIVSLLCCNVNRLITILLLMLCAFIRLEYVFILVPYLIYSAVQIILKTRRAKNFFLFTRRPGLTSPFLITAGLSAILIYTASVVQNWDIGGTRGWFAFKQWYALDQTRAGRFNLCPFVDWNIIIDQDFPGAGSVREALLINPSKFGNHVLGNLSRMPDALRSLIYPICVRFGRLIFLVVFTGMAAAYIFSSKRKLLQLSVRAAISGLGQVYVLSLFAPLALLPSLLVDARSPYSLMIMPFFFLYCGILCKTILNAYDNARYSKWGSYALICLVIFAVFMCPMPFNNKNISRPVYVKVSLLKQVWPREKIKLLGIGAYSYANYIGHERCTPIDLVLTQWLQESKNKKIFLEDIIKLYKPDAVLVNRPLLDSKIFDVGSLKMLESGNWTAYVIGDEKIYFLKQK